MVDGNEGSHIVANCFQALIVLCSWYSQHPNFNPGVIRLMLVGYFLGKRLAETKKVPYPLSVTERASRARKVLEVIACKPLFDCW